jgi:hypothetical protein
MDEEMFEKVDKLNLEDFIQEIKRSPVYKNYRKFLQENPNREDSAEFLKLTTMLITLQDKELDLLMYKLAHEVLFAMIDARFRSEIETEEGVN